ncbi:MAG: BatD family protein [Amphritea sp.]
MRNLIIPLLILSVAISQPAAAQVNVYLDRYSISQPETVQLTIEVDQRTIRRPDFSPLTRDFHFLGSKQMTISSHTNGDNQYKTRWKVLLRPRHNGALHIPALQINQEYSQPLLLNVLGNTNTPQTVSQNSYVESQIDADELYVDSQLIYTQRLFHRADLPSLATFSEPQVNAAEVVPLGEVNRYTAQVKGEEYQVIEKNYAIYPSQPGQLTIEPAIFSAGPGTTELQSAAHNIAVLPKAHQETRGYWLPARALSIEEEWLKPEPMTPGSDIIRIITVKATGLPASALPALMPLRNELATIKVSDVSLTQKATGLGLVSSRTERVVINAIERGEVTLPAIIIPWWNIKKDRTQKESLPAATLQIDPAPTVESNVVAEPTISAAPLPANQAASTSIETLDTLESRKTQEQLLAAKDSSHLLIWLLAIITMISALGWLYTYASLRKLKQQLMNASLDAEVDIEEILPQTSLGLDDADLLKIELAEQDAFQAMVSACEQNIALEARLLMIDWARHFWPQSEINNSLNLSDITNSRTLDLLLIDMENHIDGTEAGDWSGDLLADALDKIREKQMHKRLQRV